ncbi:MAG: hypothetical protein ACLSHC_11140 [Bilophila wadsworthia]
MNDTQRAFSEKTCSAGSPRTAAAAWRADYTLPDVDRRNLMQQTQMDRGVSTLPLDEAFPRRGAAAAAPGRPARHGKGSATTAARATSRPPPG